MAAVVLDGKALAAKTKEKVAQQAKQFRQRILSLVTVPSSSSCWINRCPNRQRKSIIAFANLYAAEHLIISMENPYDVADEITAAGSIFIGMASSTAAVLLENFNCLTVWNLLGQVALIPARDCMES